MVKHGASVLEKNAEENISGRLLVSYLSYLTDILPLHWTRFTF